MAQILRIWDNNLLTLCLRFSWACGAIICV